jgi:SAM-dependent methyltransferase
VSYEKLYYEYEGFWNDYNTSYINNIEKIEISFSYIREDVKTVLDAGCGNGIFTNMLVEKFPHLKVVAFDRSETALTFVRTEKYIAEIDAIPFKDSQFDLVVAHDVIEHLPSGTYEKALSELTRVSRKYVIIAVPHNEKLLERSTQCPACSAIFNYDLHMRSFTQQRLRDLLTGMNFSCKAIKTCDKNTFYWGQKWYGKVFYPEINKRFKSPICPICGYSEVLQEGKLKDSKLTIRADNPVKKFLKNLPKIVWPKYSFDYEMVALFEKNR